MDKSHVEDFLFLSIVLMMGVKANGCGDSDDSIFFVWVLCGVPSSIHFGVNANPSAVGDKTLEKSSKFEGVIKSASLHLGVKPKENGVLMFSTHRGVKPRFAKFRGDEGLEL